MTNVNNYGNRNLPSVNYGRQNIWNRYEANARNHAASVFNNMHCHNHCSGGWNSGFYGGGFGGFGFNNFGFNNFGFGGGFGMPGLPYNNDMAKGFVTGSIIGETFKFLSTLFQPKSS